MSTAAAQKKRNALYQSRFDLPETEELIADFICALKQNVLIQGRLYISQHHVCFYSKVFTKETKLVIPASEISSIAPAKSLGLIPNALKIYTNHNQYLFASFIKKKEAFDLLEKVRKGERIGKEEMIISEPSRNSNEADDESNPDDLPAANEHFDSDADEPPVVKRTKKKVKSTPTKKRGTKKSEPPPDNNSDDDHDEPQPQRKKDTGRYDNDDNDDDADVTPPPRRTPVKKKPVTKSPAKMNGIQQKGKGKRSARYTETGTANSDSDHDNNDEDLRDKNRTAKRRGIPDEPDDDNNGDDNDDADESGMQHDRALTDKAAPRRPVPAAANSDSDSDLDDEIIQKLKATKKRTNRGSDYGSIYRYPLLTTSTDPRVDEVHNKVRKQPKNFSISAPRRRFFYHGFLERQGRWSVVDRWCFLFSDVFVFTKRIDDDRYQMKQWIPLDGFTVDIRPRSFQEASLRKTKLAEPFRFIYKPPANPVVATSSSFPPALTPLPVVEYVVSAGDRVKKHDWATRLLLAIAAFYYNHNPVNSASFGWYFHFVIGTIHQSVFDRDVDLFNALLKEDPESIKSLDLEGRSLLHICAEQNDPTMIPLLFTAGAVITLTDRDGYTAIHIAAKKGSLAVLNALLADTETDLVDFNLLHHGDRATKQLRTNSALWLTVLNHNAEYADCFATLLSLSKATQRKQIMDERDDDGSTLLETVCAEHLTEVIPLLIKHGATIDLPNRAGFTPLATAAKANNLDLVTALVHCGAQPNLRFQPSLSTALHHAASLDIASLLISTGARVQLKNGKGVKITDIYPSPAAANAIEHAEELHVKRAPIDTDDPMHPQATTHALNNNHPFETCCLCQDEFSLVRKRDYCRRCGINIDPPCSIKKLIFRRKRQGKKERVLARVCDGCFNIVTFRASPTGGIGVMPKQQLKLKKKNPNQHRDDTKEERSRKGAPSVSRRWEDVESEGDEGDTTNSHHGGGGDSNDDAGTPRGGSGGNSGGHSRVSSMDDDGNDSPIEDGAGLTSNIRSGLKKGFKGAWKMGGIIGGKLTNVFDSVTDTLTSVSVPKDSIQKGGVVNEQQQREVNQQNQNQHSSQQDEDNQRKVEEQQDDIRATPLKRAKSRSAARTATSTTTSSSSSSLVSSSSSGTTSAVNTRAVAVKSSVGKSRRLAAANLDQMREIEDRSAGIEDEAESFGDLAAKLSRKSKSGK